jgi:carbonic anhydrase
VNRVAEINVRNTIRWILDNSPTLRTMAMNGEIAVVGAMYDVKSGRVQFLDGVGFATEQSGDPKASEPMAGARN